MDIKKAQERRKYLLKWNMERRKERVKNKCCANCGVKVKPIIRIPYRCRSCNDKQNKAREDGEES